MAVRTKVQRGLRVVRRWALSFRGRKRGGDHTIGTTSRPEPVSAAIAMAYAGQWPTHGDPISVEPPSADDPGGWGSNGQTGANPLRAYVDEHHTGSGIWKWSHYFEIYHRHLARFVDTKATLVEIGVFGGGSLGMWAAYLGEGGHVVGVDIQEACTRYAGEGVSVMIGDQQDREFWARFRSEVPELDIVIDDGGHTPSQQKVTLEELLPHLRPGGVYLCEDVHGSGNAFTAYVSGLVDSLNEFAPVYEPDLTSPPSPFQRVVHSVHCYPFVVVIEKHQLPPDSLIAPRWGTEWEPF